MAFAVLKTVYSDKKELNTNQLSEVYEDMVNLTNLVRETVCSKLNVVSVENKKVLLKPNWVTHNSKSTDELCLRTHDSFLIAALIVMLEMKPKSITIGDAPIQGCHWDRTITKKLLHEIRSLSEKFDIPVVVKDFRRVSFNINSANLDEEKRPISDFLIFDVGKQSYLESITDEAGTNFRVTNYDSKNLSENHKKGVHKYCIIKDVFDADIVITLPKIKTHQKTGLTNALKILVGINGDKDYLPHHRKGGTNENGDCYPGKNKLRSIAESLLDIANNQRGKRNYKNLLRLAGFIWKLSIPKNEHNFAAGWYGNDTTWRMVLDINKIAEYGMADGTLSNTPQRVIYSLCDGIIAGQGDGPLTPEPLPMGVIAFSNNSAWMDLIAGRLMGMETNKIPLLINASCMISDKVCELELNGKPIKLNELKDISVNATMPKGWINYKQK
jgi:uncharacterized protein (DUF362 family)